jgi:hypothetical protein
VYHDFNRVLGDSGAASEQEDDECAENEHA